jgi:hypothetical protein
VPPERLLAGERDGLGMSDQDEIEEIKEEFVELLQSLKSEGKISNDTYKQLVEESYRLFDKMFEVGWWG